MSQNGEKTPRVRIPRRSAPAAPATPDAERPEQQEEDWIARFRAAHYAGGPLAEQTLAETSEQQAGTAETRQQDFPPPTLVSAPAEPANVAFARVGEPPAAQPWHLRFQDRTAPVLPEPTPPSLFDWGSLATPVTASPAPAEVATPLAVVEADAPAAADLSAVVAQAEEPAAPVVAEPAPWEEQPVGTSYDWGLGGDLHEQPSGPARPSWMNDAPLDDQPLDDSDWLARFSEAASQPLPSEPTEAALPDAAFAAPQPESSTALSDSEWMARFGSAAASATTSSGANIPASKPAAPDSSISDDEWMARFGGGKTVLPPEPESAAPPARPNTPAPRQIEAPRTIIPAPPVAPGQAPHLYLDWDAIAKESETEQQRDVEQQRLAAEQQRLAAEQQREAQRAAAEQAEATARRRRRRSQQESEDEEWIAKLRSERFEPDAEVQPAPIEKRKPEPTPAAKGALTGREKDKGRGKDKDQGRSNGNSPAHLTTTDSVPTDRSVTPYTYGGALATSTNEETAAAISRITQQFSAAGVRPVEPVVIINQGGGQARSNPLGWVVIAATLVIVGFLFAIGGLGWLVSKLGGSPTAITITMPSPIITTVEVPGAVPAQPAQPAQPGEPQLAVNGKARVKTDGSPANVRTEPGLDAKLLAKLANGSEVILTEGPLVKSGNRWWKVSAPNVEDGWVAESLLVPEP